MMMECAQAQEVISAAYDGEERDPLALGNAKDHCRSCAECAEYVRTLAAIHRLPTPEMPEPALERVLAALREEYEPAPAEAAVAETETVAEPAPLPIVETPFEPSAHEGASRLRRAPAWAPWAAAAAVLLVVAGIATTQGVRYLLQPSGDTAMVGESVTSDSEREYGEDGAGTAAITPPAQDEAVTPASGPSYVLFGQEVYALVGPVDSPVSSGSVGSVTTSLDTGGSSATYAVYPGATPDTIVVAVDDDSALGFAAVVRPLRGTPFSLRSTPIGTFGQWPSLPAGIPEPSAPDGSPVFIAAGTDDLGVTIYVRPGTDPSSGFAVAPGTSSGDPAAGNTGWTWWEPQR
jgi:hypothetical protein